MKKLNEADIIALLSHDMSLPPHLHGIGDDAAVLIQGDKAQAISKDLLIQDQHFRLQYYTPAQLAKKALHVNLSDMAAMGAKPTYVFLGLGIPLTCSPEWLTDFLQAFKSECLKATVLLLGGDTTKSPHGLIISITIIGEAHKNHIKYRHTTSPSDLICLIGLAGDAHAGLLLLEQEKLGFEPLKEASCAPNAFIEEGQWLGKQSAVTAMQDTSDGVYVDLQRLCESSNVGAILNVDALPISSTLIEASTILNIAPHECALIGGEDYGLLFTVQPDQVSTLQERFANQFDTPFTQIGMITKNQQVKLQYDHKPYVPTHPFFSHF